MVSQEDLDNASWRKSSRSDTASGCVSMAPVDAYRAVRDSKDPHGPVLVFSTLELRVFLHRIKEGYFDAIRFGVNGGAAE